VQRQRQRRRVACAREARPEDRPQRRAEIGEQLVVRRIEDRRVEDEIRGDVGILSSHRCFRHLREGAFERFHLVG
jgi:hypothetical protein